MNAVVPDAVDNSDRTGVAGAGVATMGAQQNAESVAVAGAAGKGKRKDSCTSSPLRFRRSSMVAAAGSDEGKTVSTNQTDVTGGEGEDATCEILTTALMVR